MGTDMLADLQLTAANGTSVAWTDTGTGAPLVLLHGLWDTHRTWRRAAPRLAAAGHRVLTPDLPGHGLSGRPDAPYTLDWYAATVLAWLDAIGVERFDLCGHSYGGGVAQWMVLQARERIDRLALVAPGGLGREVALGLRLASFPVWGALLAPPLMRLAAPVIQRLAPGTFGHPDPDEIAHLGRMTARPGTARAFRRTVAGVINPLGQHVQTWQRIDEVRSLPPVALFWGEDDPVLPVRHAVQAHGRLPGARLSIYPRCGHYLHLDEAERFAGELTAFLARA